MLTAVDTNKSNFETGVELREHLIALTYDYACKINELERDIYEKSNADKQKDFFPEYKERYTPIYMAYCTEKRRTRASYAGSYGNPTKFDGIEDAVEKKFRSKAKGRAEVYFKTQNTFNAEYLFVLLLENEVWRIDSVRDRWYNRRLWSRAFL